MRPPCTSCTAMAGCFRRTNCTRAGSTISTGTPSSNRNGGSHRQLLRKRDAREHFMRSSDNLLTNSGRRKASRSLQLRPALIVTLAALVRIGAGMLELRDEPHGQPVRCKAAVPLS